MSLAVGNVVEGTVTGITKFGAFVELPGGSTGLIHISEIADTYVKSVDDYLKTDQQVKVKVINVDKNGKVALSMKQLEDSGNGKGSLKKKHSEGSRNQKKRKEVSFEDKLARFMKESDQKQQDLRKNEEARRRGRPAKESSESR